MDDLINNLGDKGVAFESMFRHASLGIIISNRDGVIIKVNPAASAIFGYESSELANKKIEILLPESFRAKHVHHRSKYNEERNARPMGIGMSLVALKKNGEVFPVEISLASYETKHGHEVVSFITDISVRKKNEDELVALTGELEKRVIERTESLSQAIQELQQTNEVLHDEMEKRKKAKEELKMALQAEKELGELKTRFVSMASHEFRTPLGGILTSISLISRYVEKGDIEKIGKHIGTIKDLVHVLTNILNDFLSLEKLEEGHVVYKPSLFNVEDFGRILEDEMQLVAKKGQKIKFNCTGEAREIFLDKDILKNVLINLISNAIKYSPEDSSIEFSIRVDATQIVISVTDNGIGIPAADQKHLFERFFRATNATTYQGTGLGLNIVKRYLEMMEGSVEFESVENVGTTFTVVIPSVCSN